jgi:hypothetical protein
VPRLDEHGRAALGYWWNLVTDAAQSGFTTTETTQIASQIAQELGGKVSFQESRAIAQLYGYAKRIDNASREFQNGAPDATITPNMVAIPPYARDHQEQASYPLYHVKFYYTFLDRAGMEQTEVRTSVVPMQLPDTVGEIQDLVDVDAAAFAAKYEHQLISAIPFSILAV